MADSSAITPEMKKTIGTWRLPDYSPEDVTIWGIRRYIAATEDPNPLWQDEEYAKKTRWGGVIAPPTFVEVYNPANRGYREIGGEEQLGLVFPFPPPFGRTYMGGEEFEFFVPIRPGDTIHCNGVLGDIYEKRSSSGAGTMVFIQQVKEYHNQKDELVARTKWTTIHPEHAPQAALEERPAAPEREAKPATINQKQVYFAEVNEGMAIPSMEKHVIMTTIVKWAGATGDAGRVHFDADFMRNVYGVPGVVAHGPLGGVYLAQLITNWIGGWGVFKKHSTQYRGNVFPGDIITFQGKVVRKWIEGGDNCVECETWAENPQGAKTAVGRSIVTLP
ncbi:MaoC family dehydratase N-terminal domain-containing protein [Chloroflexota bacterium]